MENNHGYRVEHAMMKWFHGRPHQLDCVDFQTNKTLFEVKSCRLFLFCSNGNNKRPYVSKSHKRIKTTQMGRFFVKLENHQKLKARAEEEKKTPKYIFVITIGKQKVWRMKSWEQIDEMMRKRSTHTAIRVKDIFNEPWEKE